MPLLNITVLAEWQAKLDGYLAIEDCADVFTSWPQVLCLFSHPSIPMLFTLSFALTETSVISRARCVVSWIAFQADISSNVQAKIFIRMVYTFMFFVMVSAIGLEIVFGIIVDSFKALREEREETDKDIRFKCFICGINRDVFDSKIMEKTAGK